MMKTVGFTMAFRLCALSLGLGLVGCGPSDNGHDGGAGHDMAMTIHDMAATQAPVDMTPASGDIGEVPDGGGATASVRFINATSARLTTKDAGKFFDLDVYLAGGATPIASAISFGQTSGWIDVPAGQPIKFDLRVAGTPAAMPPMFTTAGPDALNLPAGGHGSVIMYGISKVGINGGFKLLNLVDGFAATAGNAAARFVYATPIDNNPCTVYRDPDRGPQVKWLNATPAAGMALPAGAPFSLLVGNGVDTSQMFPASLDATWTLPASALAEGKELLLIVTGQGATHPRNREAVVMIVVDEMLHTQVLKQDPLLFVVAGVPPTPGPPPPPVAPIFDVSTTASRVKLGQLQYAGVPPGPTMMTHLSLPAGPGVTINGSSAGVAQFSSATGPLVSGERYVGVIAGLPPGTGDAAHTVQLRVYQEQFGTGTAPKVGDALLRVINESPTAPSLDVGTYDGTGAFVLVQDKTSFPDSSAGAGTETKQKQMTPPTLMPFGVGATGRDPAGYSKFPYGKNAKFDVNDPLFIIAAGDWAAAATQAVIFVRAPSGTDVWEASSAP
jgi:hypothetical protein